MGVCPGFFVWWPVQILHVSVCQPALEPVCITVNLYKTTNCLNLCVGPHFFVHLSVGLSLSVCDCTRVLFRLRKASCADSFHREGMPWEELYWRIWRLMASLEHSPAHYQLGKSSGLSPEATCQVPCPLPSSCPSFPFFPPISSG
jgi:hypothetical protein